MFSPRCYLQPSIYSALPITVEFFDNNEIIGSSAGYSSSTVKPAIGEYIERKHFYNEITHDTKCRLDSSNSSFLYAFDQMKSDKTADTSSHCFHMNHAINMTTGENCNIPSICLSMNDKYLHSDKCFMPVRDTCGNSFHWSLKNAVQGSIKELLERQFLLKFWLTSICNKRISLAETEKAIKDLSEYKIFSLLYKKGELEVIDISNPDFPGSCVIAIYGCSDRDEKVKYCTGMSYAENIQQAIQKSLLELWQTFKFLNLYECAFLDKKELIKDPYQIHFIESNNYDTFKTINSISEKNFKSKNKKAFNTSSLLQPLIRNNINTFLYCKQIGINGNQGYVSKFISPDMFMHMNNSRNINIDNLFFNEFYDTIISSRRNIMVPFP